MAFGSDANKNLIEDVRLRAAIGYFELGMLDEAWEELDELDPAVAVSIPATKVRVMLLLREERWDRALKEAQKICKDVPDDPEGFIHAAYCLHEMGKTGEAEKLLLGGPQGLRDEPVYFYNLACYKAVSGNTDEAVVYLRKAFAMDGNLSKVARTDPDLKKVRDRL